MENIVIIKIYPSIGRGSYEVHIDVPGWVKRLDMYIQAWIDDSLINVKSWEYINKGIWN